MGIYLRKLIMVFKKLSNSLLFINPSKMKFMSLNKLFITSSVILTFFKATAQPVVPTSNVPVTVQPPLPVSYIGHLDDYINTTYRNFIRTYQPHQPTTNGANVTNNNIQTIKSQVQTSYFDGLGRPMQDV